MTRVLTSGLARSGTSNRQGSLIIASTLHALGENPNTFATSKGSLRRARIRNRTIMSDCIKSTFDRNDWFTVHWDGKLLPDKNISEKIERLAIAVSSTRGDSKLLGIPKLPDSTGESQSAAVILALENWSISSRVKLLSFDTTASNTGTI